MQTPVSVQAALPQSPFGSASVLLRAQRLQHRKFSKSVTWVRKSSFFPQLCHCSFGFSTNGSGSRRSAVRCSVAKETDGVAEQKQQTGVKRAYPFHEIEPKWQRYWEDNSTFRTPDEIDTSKPKFYVLDMFPYPRFSLSHFILFFVFFPSH